MDICDSFLHSLKPFVTVPQFLSQKTAGLFKETHFISISFFLEKVTPFLLLKSSIVNIIQTSLIWPDS